MNYQDTVWQTADLTNTYLEGVRGAIPLANEQIEIMLLLISAACPTVSCVLDLGCGDGILGQAVLDKYPKAKGIFVDFSQPMLDAAARRLDGYERHDLLLLDYGDAGWVNELPEQNLRINVIISGFSIHHQPDSRKKEIYAELFDLLEPGGIFLNLEHVLSPTKWIQERFAELFVNSLFNYHQRIGTGKSIDQINQDFYDRPDKKSNILASVEDQCYWLRQIGFEQVDCYLKVFELALFGGQKPDFAHH